MVCYYQFINLTSSLTVETVIEMLNSSKHDLHKYLQETYGAPYEMTSDCLFELFNHLDLYYTAKVPPNLTATFQHFFENLSRKLIFLLLHDFDLTGTQSNCLHNYTLQHDFFAGVPVSLTLQVCSLQLLFISWHQRFNTHTTDGTNVLTPI